MAAILFVPDCVKIQYQQHTQLQSQQMIYNINPYLYFSITIQHIKVEKHTFVESYQFSIVLNILAKVVWVASLLFTKIQIQLFLYHADNKKFGANLIQSYLLMELWINSENVK